MIRVQVQLAQEQARTLKALAAQRQSSVAELIRQSVDSLIATSIGVSADERRRRAIAAIGRYGSGSSDRSIRHDVYLAEAYDPCWCLRIRPPCTRRWTGMTGTTLPRQRCGKT